MTAEILAVGTEILLGQIADTNSQELGRLLADYGFDHYRRTTVGDNLNRIADALAESLQRADVVFTIGGLGPTQDDVTREAIATALGVELVEDQTTLQWLKERVQRQNRPWLESLGRQAQKPEGATLWPNPVGTAPGLLIERKGKTVIALPGPKGEFRAMLEQYVAPYLAKRTSATLQYRVLRILDMPESAVEDAVRDLIASSSPTVAPLMHPGEVHLRVAAKGASQAEAEAEISPVVEQIRLRFGAKCFEEEPAKVLLDRLRVAGATLSVAESCTGGLLGATFTRIPGASDAFLGGFITYSNEAKASLLGVARSDLNQYGAVSETVAIQMARGARRALQSTYSLAITGIAGPGGRTESKPVGLVYLAAAGPSGERVIERRYGGDRDLIRARSVASAFVLLREMMERP